MAIGAASSCAPSSTRNSSGATTLVSSALFQRPPRYCAIDRLQRRGSGHTCLTQRHMDGKASIPAGLGSGGSLRGLLHTTPIRLERNVVRNTLADTPSGYIQDPRVAPKLMRRYDSVSRVGAAAIEAMEREKQLLEQEELAYRGFTTLRIQELKRVVLAPGSTPADLEGAVEGLKADLVELLSVVDQEVEKPISQEHILLLKWQQRQQRLHDRDLAFHVAPVTNPGYRVVQQADGTEVLERPGRDTPQTDLPATDDAYLSQPVETEELPASALVPERVVVTIADVNHVRYLIGLALRRLSRFEEAEKMLYSVLADDVTNVDAVESLLEMDLGVEGWEPRLRVLLDFLVAEFDTAVREGRLQRSTVGGVDNSVTSQERDQDTESEATASASSAAAPSIRDAEGVHEAATTATATTTSTLPTPANAITASRTAAPYATVPQAAPIEVALSLLSDIIVEAAAQKYSTDGEGATSRFFIESLGPIMRALGRDYAPAVLAALFQAVDEQHFMARFDSDDVSPAARAFTLGIVIAFLKALTARRVHEMMPNPVQFEFFTASKLHAALRRAGRLHESYHICDKMMKLYRDNSAVYRARLRRRSTAALPRTASAFLEELAQPQPQHRALFDTAPVPEEVGDSGEEEASPSPASAGPSTTSPSPLTGSGQLGTVEEDNVAAGAASTCDTAAEEVSEDTEEPPDVLDDQDGDYREAFFQYVNDRARDSPSLGRRLCLEAMREFPNCAAPWETLALLLHKENPERNLHDAIVAARHGLLLEPLNLSVIVTLANFYKAAGRYELHERMLDRYRLLAYMAEEGASVADMQATAAEVEALDRVTPEAQDLVAETGREMSEYMFRLEQATTYSMPIDKETRHFRKEPVRFFSQQPDMRPPEVRAHESDPEDKLSMDTARRPLT
ncbi:hypothetical protein ABB37_02106 [Leptomonas pyrrhocoris]|uniref:Uncharacterized protein n=1 Tax=Leptomonas pyrrhocoris TaxID=157538 RepID=A0A0N0DYB8_LEPPY|nr:hypothetical protein ABB37_02106 [Leptomonas pyrrhocoris]KPA83955.1 hypothetical protein ABB37_02106 [Leptomonas pyrrhocoris]|eukprot:XP_015662394.1 hypothetical protein ABB37_02106 [Leptomonas pyrrhocoris]